MRQAARNDAGAAHAKADDAERADTFDIALGRGDIGHHVIPIEIAEIAAGMRDFVRRVATFEIAHETIEHRGRDRNVAERSKPVADRADMVIDPENLLHHHHAALRRAGRIGAVSAERVFVGCGQSELLTQRNLP